MTGFNLEATDGTARTGTLRTAHGDVRTPAFMPVATVGSVKALDPDDLRTLGVEGPRSGATRGGRLYGSRGPVRPQS